MRDVKLKAKKVAVLVRLSGTPYPEIGYGVGSRIYTAPGYEVQWCRKVLWMESEVIDCKYRGKG